MANFLEGVVSFIQPALLLPRVQPAAAVPGGWVRGFMLGGLLLTVAHLGWAQEPTAGKAQLYAVVGAGRAAQFSVPQVKLADEAVAGRINRDITRVLASYATTPLDSAATLARQLKQAAAQPCCLGGVRFLTLLNQNNLLSLKLTLVFNGNLYYERTRYLVYDLITGRPLPLSALVADSPAQLTARLETALNRRVGEFLADTTARAPAALAAVAERYHWNPATRRVVFGPAGSPAAAPPIDLTEFGLTPHALVLVYRVGTPTSTLADTPDEAFRIPYARLQVIGPLVPLARGNAAPAR